MEITTWREWRSFAKTRSDIPSVPQDVYADEWIDHAHFFTLTRLDVQQVVDWILENVPNPTIKAYQEAKKPKHFPSDISGFLRRNGLSFREIFRPALEAFGETRTMDEWYRDKRCVARDRRTLWRRVYELGWSLEDAITTPPGQRPAKKDVK